MKEELSIDELLNSLIDGELTARQETEVRRLIDNDPQIARRLRQLQKCRILMSSLPAVEAPPQISDHIKIMLKARAQRGEQTPVQEDRARTRNLLPQRILAVAAMIGLVVVLTAVIYSIAPTERIETIESNPNAVADRGFSGSLELNTSDLIAVDSFVKRKIEDNGFADQFSPTQEPNRRVYFISCSKEGLDRLLADLDNIWDKLDSTRLIVDTEVFREQIVVDAVTIEQIVEIAGQQNSVRLLEVAKDYAVFNSTAESLPGRDIFSAIDDRMGNLTAIHKPFYTEKIIEKSGIQEESEKTIQLTIIVSR